jgi:methylation protein EvaC
MHKCLVCEHELTPFLHLGNQPSANRFLKKEDLHKKEYKFPLEVGFCQNCKMVQTLQRPKKEEMFKSDYAYFTSTNQPMVEHFEKLANTFKKNFLNKDSFIAEIGSNDGTFLRHFTNFNHLGIEPSTNVAKVATSKGVHCFSKFFNEKTAKEVSSSYGKADILFAANVIGHIEEIRGLLKGVKELLSHKGKFVFEIYYLPEILRKGTFDLIYDEHIFYYTLINLTHLFKTFDLELYDVEFIPVHGGSIRGYVSHKNSFNKSQRLLEGIKEEKERLFDSIKPLENFSIQIQKTKSDLKALINKLKDQGKTIAGYGATAKSTTLINFCELDNKLIDFIVDSTPIKQGKFSPGKHIPIIKEEDFMKTPPDYTLLFAWNYQKEILEKQKGYTEKGGKWISTYPTIKIL